MIITDTPCWFELGMKKGTKVPTLTLSLHASVTERLREFDPRHARTDLAEKFEFPAFSVDARTGLGYGGILRYEGAEAGMLCFSAEFPRISWLADMRCLACRGTKKDSFQAGSDCTYCAGSGRERAIRWNDAYRFSASLAVLAELALAFPPEHSTRLNRQQLFSLTMGAQEGFYGGRIGAGVAPVLAVRLAANRAGSRFREIETVMREVYRHLWAGGLLMADRDDFRAEVHDRGIILFGCPDASLVVDHWDVPPGRGYELTPHNTDSPLHQTTLLSGLAALHDLVRESEEA